MGYQCNLLYRLIRPTQNRWESLQQKLVSLMSKSTCPVIDLHCFSLQRRLAPYEAHSVAPEEQLISDLYTLTSMEDPGSSCPYSQPLQPLQHTLQVFTDRRKLGCSLRRLQFRWDLVHSRKQCTHKFSGIKRRFASS